MDALNQAHSHSSEHEEDSQAKSLEVQSASGQTLRPLPRNAGLPVVVAVRMSLSFPLLLSAVPLHAIDWSLKDNAQRKRESRPLLAKRVWFSDGGIGSNMPLHMFDSLLPGHPTFAVNLKAEHPDHQISTPEAADNAGGRVYLPEDRRGGMQRYWQPADDTAPLSGLIGFFSSIVNTMQSWRDEIMFPYPGFRERIVQISQRDGEGGLNLDMPSDTIEALGNAGAMAADRLIDSFHPSGAQHAEGWRRHREARLKTLLGTLQPASEAIGPALQSGVWHTVVDTIASYEADERQLAKDYLNELQVLGTIGAGHRPSMQDVAPKPLAQLKISPRI
ncbi:patatin-like phospholipase family protein [Xanthomonas sp. NCPPB 1067]|nr:patatin-like phospholipase family protein [Xanthomonas sp. NCPPB 1067]MCC4586429.1 patatin-like phospholipase family protein [Xanthomonas sp. NCPPB 1067]